MIDFPETVAVVILDSKSGGAIAGIAAKVRLRTHRKNDYNFLLPVSDRDGRIVITREWLLKEIRLEQALFVMDYSSSLAECEPEIVISVLSVTDLSRAVSAMRFYREFTGMTEHEIKGYEQATNADFAPMSISVNVVETTSPTKIFLHRVTERHS